MNYSTKNLANNIIDLVPNTMAGSLRFFGVWFGRPYDNIHRIVGAEANGNILLVYFEESEILEVYKPHNCSFSANNFEIRKAQSVTWKWYYYGRPKTKDNLYYDVFELDGEKISMRTNVYWYKEQQVALISEPAVKIYSS